MKRNTITPLQVPSSTLMVNAENPSAGELEPMSRCGPRLLLLLLALALWKPEASGQVVFESLLSFGTPTFSALGSTARLSKGTDGAWYGTTEGGGLYGRGTVFKVNQDGSGSVVLHSFSAGDGWSPFAALSKGSDGAWYGTTLGDSVSYGTVFRINEDGSGFAVLHRFAWSEGSMLIGNLSKGSDGAWYGTARDGGGFNGGTVFKINEDGTGFAVLHNFSWSDEAGASPYAGLSQGSDGAWYGTTASGGNSGAGTVFKVNQDGTGFVVLHSFSGADGGTPQASLTQGNDGAWYGTTLGAGSAPYGTLFRVNGDGTGFSVLHRFDGHDGSNPYAPLSLGPDGLWYGTTSGGYDGASGGTVFRLNSDGSGFLVLHSFSGPDGSHSFGALSHGDDGAWYGTTQQGGQANFGTVFRLWFTINHPPVIGVDQRTLTVNEGETASNSGLCSDVDNDVVTISASVGTVTVLDGVWRWSYAATDGLGDSQSVTLVANDSHGGTATTSFALVVNNVAPTVTIERPVSGFLQTVNTTVVFDGSFTDPGLSDTHTAQWVINSATLAETRLSATVNGSAVADDIAFSTPGVYSISLEVTDNDGGVGEANTVANDLPAYIVIYDPNGGFVTGGGWIWSPPGAMLGELGQVEGKACFGFVAAYHKGASVPEGNTQFQFKAGDLNFHSTSYNWLVVSGARAQFKGLGSINGTGDYAFMLTAIDGQINGGSGQDRFRIKIWDKASGNIVYDNQMGADDTAGLSDQTIIGGGSITIQTSKN